MRWDAKPDEQQECKSGGESGEGGATERYGKAEDEITGIGGHSGQMSQNKVAYGVPRRGSDRLTGRIRGARTPGAVKFAIKKLRGHRLRNRSGGTPDQALRLEKRHNFIGDADATGGS